MKRSGYEIANEVENKQNGGQGGISVEPSGTLYRPIKFFSALPYNEKGYTSSEGKNSKRLSLRNIAFSFKEARIFSRQLEDFWFLKYI